MKSGWNWLLRAMAAVALAVVGISTVRAAEVRNVKAAQNWPWTSTVGISYEVVGALPTNAELVVTAQDRTGNATYTAYRLAGDTGIDEGTHHVVWDLALQGIKLQSTNVLFTVAYQMPGLYCVVDLSGGANATSYPVTYMDEPPSGGFNTDAYKTTKLVLRRLPAGTFKMNGSYQVTLSKPFYAGVFEVTQKQYALVMGSYSPSDDNSMRPEDSVSYDWIRGKSSWPADNEVDASSFLGKLRARTGVEFDLPTEAQWEYACRAGTTNLFNNGGSTEYDMNELGRYIANANGDYSHNCAIVGSYRPNAWGLYDMHGNVWEWCLDWFGSLSGGTDPKGPPSSDSGKRVIRGGSWAVFEWYCTSSARGGCASWCAARTSSPLTWYVYEDLGFRLARTLSN